MSQRSKTVLAVALAAGMLAAMTSAQYPQPPGQVPVQGNQYPPVQPIVPADVAKYTAEDPTVQDLYRVLKEIHAAVVDPANPKNTAIARLEYITALATQGPADAGLATHATGGDPFLSGAMKCVACHKEPARKGGLALWNAQGQPYQLSAEQAGEVVRRINLRGPGQMPPVTSPQQTPAEKAAWNQKFGHG